jgi:hypothetical protein
MGRAILSLQHVSNFLVLFVFDAYRVSASYYTRLKDIRSSEGAWKPTFSPDTFAYNVTVGPTARSIKLECDVDFERYDRPGNYPTILLNGDSQIYGPDDPVVRRIAFDGGFLKQQVGMQILVSKPHVQSPSSTYFILFTRLQDLEQTLKLQSLELRDESGPLALDPPFGTLHAGTAVRPFQVQLAPNLFKVRFTASCNDEAGARLQVDDRDTGSLEPRGIDVNAHAARTKVRVTCSYQDEQRNVYVNIVEKVDLSALAVGLQVMGNVGNVKAYDNGTTFLV